MQMETVFAYLRKRAISIIELIYCSAIREHVDNGQTYAPYLH